MAQRARYIGARRGSPRSALAALAVFDEPAARRSRWSSSAATLVGFVVLRLVALGVMALARGARRAPAVVEWRHGARQSSIGRAR